MFVEIIKALLIPPAINCVLLVVGLLFLRRYRLIGHMLITVAVVSLFLLSTDYVASALERSNQKYAAVDTDKLPDDQQLTIVVAGGSHHGIAEEYGYPVPTTVSLTRLHYASYLHRKTGYPVLLTGGPMYKNQIHSEILAQSFSNEFKTDARWLETNSRSTDENAQFSADILLPLGRRQILLVTHSYHMNRAVKSFQKAGFAVIPAPTIISYEVGIGNWRHWVPLASGLQRSANVIYEIVGLARDNLSLQFNGTGNQTGNHGELIPN